MKPGMERLDLLQQPVDQLLGAADRQRRDVIDRLVGIELGALAARMRERVDDLALHAEQAELEHRKEADRPRADDDAFGADGGLSRGVAHVRDPACRWSRTVAARPEFYPMIGLGMAHALETPLLPLARDFRELRARGRPFVLATILATEGSTYRKAGTPMLITDAPELHGLLSGGCLELDLVEHARAVLDSGVARTTDYDMRGENDLIFGIGSGCEGAMRVLLQRVGPDEGWQPLAAVAARLESAEPGAIAILADG